MDKLDEQRKFFEQIASIYLALESKININELLATISFEITKFLAAERTSLFLYNKQENVLFTKVAEGLEDKIIKLKIGQGIAGRVAETKKPYISNDVYNCPYFDSTFDKLFNYKTRNTLCMPLINPQNEIVGIIQVLNKINGEFDESDIEKLGYLTTITAVALDNAKLFEELKELKEYNENIIDTVNFGIIVINHQNKIRSFNTNFEKFLEENNIPITRDIFEILYFIDDLEKFINDCRKNRYKQVNEYTCLLNNHRKYFNIKFIKLLNSEDYVLIILDDATEFVSLKKSEHLAIIGKFASSIIHDIKSPLAIISGYTQLIHSRTDKSEIKKFSETILEEIDRLVNMSREILEFAKGELTLNNSVIKISDFIKLIENNTKIMLENESMQFEVNIIDDAFVNIDIERFKRVIYNIVQNAISAMKPNGLFKIEIKKNTINKIDIYLIDNGIGMSEKLQKMIFEPFVSYNKRNGTGLGMAIVKKVLEEHGGNIAVESKENKGTKFIITLPIINIDEVD